VTASHGLLDALTDGGLGVALFSPFTQKRFFFSWTPIEVSPFGWRWLLKPGERGVLWSELKWVWGPVLVLAGILRPVNLRLRKPRQRP
jgi:inner membrane protein